MSEATEIPSPTSYEPPRGKSGRRRRLPLRRAALLLTAIIGALLASLIAFNQHPRPDLRGASGLWAAGARSVTDRASSSP